MKNKINNFLSCWQATETNYPERSTNAGGVDLCDPQGLHEVHWHTDLWSHHITSHSAPRPPVHIIYCAGWAIIPCLNRSRGLDLDLDLDLGVMLLLCVCVWECECVSAGADGPLPGHSNRCDDRKRDNKPSDLFPCSSSGRGLVDTGRTGFHSSKEDN